MKLTGKRALERAVELLETQTALAAAIAARGFPNVKQAHVWYWLNTEDAQIPAEYCGAIEAATGGRITREQLRPDLFGAAAARVAQG